MPARPSPTAPSVHPHPRGPGRFAGRVALVSGAGGGIGRAVAERFVEEGARVVLTGRRPGPLEELASQLSGQAIACPGDAADPVAMADTMERTVAAFGRLDVVVANAGAHRPGRVGDLSDPDWAHSCRSNLDSAFVTIRAALPLLEHSRGNVVVIGSIAGHYAGPDVAGYVTTKHALVGLTRSVARDYGRDGIRANLVAPGWVRTAMADEQMDELARARGLDRESAYDLVTRDLPLGRAALPREIAAVVAFLASDEAAVITGATVVADAGSGCVDLPTIAFAPERTPR